jgi:hypothetical protein
VIEEEDDVELVVKSRPLIYLAWQAIATGEVIADYGEPTRWSDWDASVFLMTKVGQQMQGEYQLCNGYGADKAASVLRVSLPTSTYTYSSTMYYYYIHVQLPFF